MAEITLRGILSQQVLPRLSGSKSGSSAVSLAVTGSGAGGDSSEVASTLSLGVRVFNAAYMNLNTAASFVNISKDTLEKLARITDKLITVTERATKADASDGERTQLDQSFKKLGREFRQIVRAASIDGYDLLTEDGLDRVLSLAGLDKKDAETIAALYKKFLTGPGDDSLVSENVKGIRPVAIPPDAYGKTTGSASSSVTTGDGTFQARQAFAGSSPDSVAIADFNADGFNDLVTADYNGNAINVFQGNGDGTFQGSQAFATGTTPYSLAIGDLNGDGFNDLVTTDKNDSTVSVFQGNGDGTFQARQVFTTGSSPVSVAIADLNGDGFKDLVTADYNGATVSVFQGNGNGTFQASQTYTTGSNPSSVAIADLNGDGFKDLVTADYGSNTVSVFQGNSNGTFQGRQAFAAGSGPGSVAIADFNGDGIQDLVTAEDGSSTVSVFQGNANGTFQARQAFATGLNPISVAIADLNGDGFKDLVTAEIGSDTVSVLRGNGNGTFQARLAYATGSTPLSVAIGDLNGDGVNDLVSADKNSNAVGVRLGTTTVTVTTGVSALVLPPLGSEFKRIFSPGRSIAERPEAYRTLSDLKALKKQIKTNIDGLDNAVKVIGENIALVYQSATAFSDTAESKAETPASALAGKLAELIERNAGSALNQLENLTPVAIAALTNHAALPRIR